MTDDKRERVNLSLSEGELGMVDKMLKRTPWRFQKRSAALKCLILHLCENKGSLDSLVTERNRMEPAGNQLVTGTKSATRGRERSPKKKEELAKRETRPEIAATCQRIIGHFNQTCAGRVSILDKGATEKLTELLAIYSEEDICGVISWAQRRWPPGDQYRHCVQLSYLCGDKFGDHLTQSLRGRAEPPPKAAPMDSAEEMWEYNKRKTREREAREAARRSNGEA